MAEYLEKLRPDRDLQCYFQRPSAIAALSATSAGGFTVSGCWRQQFDWAVVEWNRDNVFEHPAFRNLPDGDLSGLKLSYEETRTNCIPLDSTLFPTVEWPYMRIWAEAGGVETLYLVSLKDHAAPIGGAYQSASAIFQLNGSASEDDYIELAWGSEHSTHRMYYNDTLTSGAKAIVDGINAYSTSMRASLNGTTIELTYDLMSGANANRIGVYANVTGAKTEQWVPTWQNLSGGSSPTKWQINLDFSSLIDINGVTVPTNSIRKMRWTWAADIQPGSFVPSEFSVVVSNWTVSGTNRRYQVAGPSSSRTEDDCLDLKYAGPWVEARGNFSGGSIRYTTVQGSSVSYTYWASQNHRLYLGARKAPTGSQITIVVDNNPARIESLVLAGEDVLVRIALGDLAGQVSHTVTITHSGVSGSYFYFDFLEVAVPHEDLPVFLPDVQTTLATDWDTDHSMALAPERTAWLIKSLGFLGRANHYAGALWFYQLCRPANQYAWGTIEFQGTREFGKTTEVFIGGTQNAHPNLAGDTPVSLAKAFEYQINASSTEVWAQAEGPVLTIHARAMGAAGNAITISVNTNSTSLTAVVSGSTLSGGVDGAWLTDLNAVPRLNRAVRDWGRSYYSALKGYGIDVTAAFSMELQHGDTSPAAGIAQCYPDGTTVWLNTPALQTNFSPASTAFWKQAYLEMANLLAQAGQAPFLQFGEVQWWYFPASSGMPFYDDYTKSAFQAAYGRQMHVFLNGDVSPALYPDESAFLPKLIGNFTNAVIDFVRQAQPTTQFEVLYPPDVNEASLNQVINLPATDWTPAKLDSFKTENFSYNGARDLNKVRQSIQLPMQLGFPREKSSHLVGIGDYTTPWEKENRLSKGEGLGSVVLFALDQFCLIGYGLPLSKGLRRSLFFGS